MSVLQFCTWCENSGLGNTIRNSPWMFPIIEVFHLLGLAVIGGAVLMINLRLFGLGLKRQPAGEVLADVKPFLIGSLMVMIVSGGLLFSSEAIKCYYHGAFWFKMASLLLAIVFTFTVQRGVIARADTKNIGPMAMKLVALVSLILWTGVGIAGRWIGFS
jgi:hypothetical protein